MSQDAQKLNKRMKSQIMRLLIGALQHQESEEESIQTFIQAVEQFQADEDEIEIRQEFEAMRNNRKVLKDMQRFIQVCQEHGDKQAAMNAMIDNVEDWVGFPFMQKLIDVLKEDTDDE